MRLAATATQVARNMRRARQRQVPRYRRLPTRPRSCSSRWRFCGSCAALRAAAITRLPCGLRASWSNRPIIDATRTSLICYEPQSVTYVSSIERPETAATAALFVIEVESEESYLRSTRPSERRLLGSSRAISRSNSVLTTARPRLRQSKHANRAEQRGGWCGHDRDARPSRSPGSTLLGSAAPLVL